MSKLSLAGLGLIGLAACTNGTPKQVASKTAIPPARAEVKPTTPTRAAVKPVTRPAATRTPAARKPAHQTAVRDTTHQGVNPLTNH